MNFILFKKKIDIFISLWGISEIIYFIALIPKSNLFILSSALPIIKIILDDKLEGVILLNSYGIKLEINIEFIPHFLNK